MTKARLAVDANGVAIQGTLHPKVHGGQFVAYGVAAAVSTAISADIVRIVATTDCYVRFGRAVTDLALNTDMFLKSGTPEYFCLNGDTYISAIRVSGDGNLHIQIME